MLFGKNPFNATNLQQLKTMVQRDSGKNLRFGQEAISDLSKDILTRLLEANPAKRITWAQFFTHSLFADKNNSAFGYIAPLKDGISSSYFDADQASAVNSRFFEDRNKAMNKPEFVYPDVTDYADQNS